MSRKFIIALSLTLIFFTLLSFLFRHPKNREISSLEPLACSYSDLSGLIDLSQTAAVFEGQEIAIPKIALKEDEYTVLSAANEERWVEVDLSDQKLYAWEGSRLFLETPVSTGLPWWPTPKGEFRVWTKLRATKMEGGEGKYYYNLPNVPYVMYFENSQIPGWRGYGLHGAYWHNDFGRPRSHGCVNLPVDVAKQIYYWISPVLTDNKNSIKATGSNPGTKIVIHE